MKQFVFGLVTAAAIGGVVAISRSDSPLDARAPGDPSELKIESGDKNPWTALKLNNERAVQLRGSFDRTGGHRDKVFSQRSRA